MHSWGPRIHIYNNLRMTPRRILLFCVLCLLTFAGCKKQDSETQTATANEAKPVIAAEASTPASSATTPAPTDSGPQINPTRAFQYVKEFVSIGSRPPGSPGHAKAEQFIKSHLAGDNVEVDSFTTKTPVGEFPDPQHHCQVSGKERRHHRHRRALRNQLPLPARLRRRERRRLNHWPVAGVGEPASRQTERRLQHLAGLDRWRRSLREMERQGQPLWHEASGRTMAAGWNRKENQSFHSARHDRRRRSRRPARHQLNSLVERSGLPGGKQVGIPIAFLPADDRPSKTTICPFAKIGVPVVDIIDIDYGYADAYHHTTQDTLDKLSPQSLAIVGDVVLETIRLVNAR